MKTIQYLYRTFILLVLSGTFSSCVQKEAEMPSPIAKSGVPVLLSLGNTTTDKTDLAYALYVFSHAKGSSDAYIMEKSINPLQTDTKLKFSNTDLTAKDYRFLFTATPQNAPEIRILTIPAETPPTTGTPWEDIRMGAQAARLSVHNYYQIKDIPGQDIITDDSIRGHLCRIVGQMEFRFFKIGKDMSDVQKIDLTAIRSVFDRIYQIDIKYTGFTNLLSFKDGKTPVAETFNTEGITQQITLTPDANLKIALPQNEADTLSGGASVGGKIKGLYFFPAPAQLQATLIFHYYDTTPKCEKPGETHTSDCYEQQTLELHIPLNQANVSGIPVEADTYTINQIGIRCDRVIDINVNENTELLTNWNAIY